MKALGGINSAELCTVGHNYRRTYPGGHLYGGLKSAGITPTTTVLGSEQEAMAGYWDYWKTEDPRGKPTFIRDPATRGIFCQLLG